VQKLRDPALKEQNLCVKVVKIGHDYKEARVVEQNMSILTMLNTAIGEMNDFPTKEILYIQD
jgi:hypothetical protein